MIDHGEGERVKQKRNFWLSPFSLETNGEYSKRKPALNGESEIFSD